MKTPLYLLVLCCLVLLPTLVAASAPPDSTRNAFARGLDKVKLQKARTLFLENNVPGALEKYRELYSKDQSNALVNFRIGECLVRMRMYRDAVAYLEKALRNGPEVDKLLYLNLGMVYHRLDDLEQAAKHLDTFLERAKNKIDIEDGLRYRAEVAFAQRVQQNPVPVKVSILGSEINSPFVDSNPAMSPDGKTLMYTSRRPENKGGQLDGSGQYYEDVWMSKWDSVNNKWGQGAPVEGRMNTPSYDASLSFSADGTRFYMYRNLGEEGSGEVFYSKLGKTGKWSSPRAFPKPINTSYMETGAAFTEDGKTLFFCSERKGGEGQADIWMAKSLSRSEWEEPVNLGPMINTPLDEISVWCNADGTELYFTSNGHLSVGGYDIFRSTFENGVWSAPANLGYPLNTVANELHFTFSHDHKTAMYISQSDDGFGSYDIFSVDLSNSNPLDGKQAYSTKMELTGTVSNDQGKPVPDAQVTILHAKTGKKVASTNSGRKGTWAVMLPSEQEYVLQIVAKGYPEKREEVAVKAGLGAATSQTVNTTL